MKVSIDHTVEITDEQRVQMADVIDGKRTKRQATRDDMKEYIWLAGKEWAATLTEEWENLFGPERSEEPKEDTDEDLIGGEDADDDEDLI